MELAIACSTTVNFPLGRIARFGSTSSVWSNAGKRHLPDTRRESRMLCLNPAIAMVRPKRTSHPAAALPRRSAPQCQHRVRRQHARPRRPPDRTSRPESPAIARMPDQRGCTGKPLCQPSRPPHEYRPGIRPKDATDKEARPPRSRGRSVVVLYNETRTHL